MLGQRLVLYLAGFQMAFRVFAQLTGKAERHVLGVPAKAGNSAVPLAMSGISPAFLDSELLDPSLSRYFLDADVLLRQEPEEEEDEEDDNVKHHHDDDDDEDDEEDNGDNDEDTGDGYSVSPLPSLASVGEAGSMERKFQFERNRLAKPN